MPTVTIDSTPRAMLEKNGSLPERSQIASVTSVPPVEAASQDPQPDDHDHRRDQQRHDPPPVR